MEELKPVGWQYKAKDKNREVWSGCSSGSVEILKEEGFETRALYAIPDGYVVVPVEPLKESLVAGVEKYNAALKAHCHSIDCMHDAYKAMLADASFQRGSVVDEEV